MWAYDQQARNLFKQEKLDDSCHLYKKALAILPSHLGCLGNYSIVLAHLAQRTQIYLSKPLSNIIKHYPLSLITQIILEIMPMPFAF